MTRVLNASQPKNILSSQRQGLRTERGDRGLSVVGGIRPRMEFLLNKPRYIVSGFVGISTSLTASAVVNSSSHPLSKSPDIARRRNLYTRIVPPMILSSWAATTTAWSNSILVLSMCQTTMPRLISSLFSRLMRDSYTSRSPDMPGQRSAHQRSSIKHTGDTSMKDP